MSNNRESLEQQRENNALKNYSPVKKNFDGTQPKIVHDAQEPVTKSMQEMIERDAEKQDTTVPVLKVEAAVNEANTNQPDPIEESEPETPEQLPEKEEAVDENNLGD